MKLIKIDNIFFQSKLFTESKNLRLRRQRNNLMKDRYFPAKLREIHKYVILTRENFRQVGIIKTLYENF